jgi:hypothetical protein
VAHVGRLGGDLGGFVKVCERIIFEGPKAVRIRRAG